MVCGYRLTKRQSVLVLLSSLLAIVFFATFAWNSDSNTSQVNESEVCGINGKCDERIPGERGGVQRNLNTVRDSQYLSESRNGHQRRRKGNIHFPKPAGLRNLTLLV